MKTINIDDVDFYDSIEVAKAIKQSHQNFKKKLDGVTIKVENWEGKGIPISKIELIEIINSYDLNRLHNGNKSAIEDFKNELRGIPPPPPIELTRALQNNQMLNEQAKDLSTKNARLNTRNVRLNEEKEELNAALSELTTKYNQLNSGSSELNTTVSQLNTDNRKFNSKLTELNATNKQLNAINEELNFKVSELNALRGELSRERDELNANNIELNADSTKHQIKIIELNAIITKLESKKQEIISDYRHLIWGRNPINWVVNLLMMMSSPIIAFLYRREFLFIVVAFFIFIQGHQISALLASEHGAGDNHTAVFLFGILFEMIPLIMVINHGSKFWIYGFAFAALIVNYMVFAKDGYTHEAVVISAAIPFALISFTELFKQKT